MVLTSQKWIRVLFLPLSDSVDRRLFPPGCFAQLVVRGGITLGDEKGVVWRFARVMFRPQGENVS